MSGFDTTLDLLIETRHNDADRLLGHVLSGGDAGLRERTVERLLTTTRGRRQAEIVRCWGDLGDELRRRVLERLDRLGPALRHAMATREPAMQRTAIELIAEADDLSLAYLVGEGLRSADGEVRGRSAELLWNWAREFRRAEIAGDGAGAGSESGSRRRRFLLEALQCAVAGRSPEGVPQVLRAAAMVADDSAAWFWGAISARRDVRRGMLFRLLGEELEPEMMGFVVRALRREATVADASALVVGRLGRRQLKALLDEVSHQPRLPDRACVELAGAQWLRAGDGTLERLPADLVAEALAVALRGGADDGDVAALCRVLAVEHDDPEARRLAVDALARLPEVGEAELRLVAADAPAATSVRAALHLVRGGAGAALPPQAVGKVLDQWNTLADADRRDVARSAAPLLHEQPELLAPHFEMDRPTRLVALSLARMARAVGPHADALKRMASDTGDARLRSAAVMAIAECRAEGVDRMLGEALNSADARVRANAAEGLDRREAAAEVFLRLENDENNRVRANTARALIERGRPEGRRLLGRMLKGPEADRLSALWVFARVRPDGFGGAARLLALGDPSERVRAKASELMVSG